jgi:hypothetical protein
VTMRATAGRATPRELAIVFGGLLLAALVVSRWRAAVLAVAPDGVRSLLITASLGTLAFAGLRAAAGRSRLAWIVTGSLPLALVCSSLAAAAANRLIARPVIPTVPEGLVQVADWIADRSPTWLVHEPALAIRPDRHVVIDGAPEADFSYLGVAKAQHFEEGTHVVVEGVVQSGGVTIGLMKTGVWMAYTTIAQPGPFRSWVVVPRDDDYELVVAYGVAAHVRTQIDVSPLTLWK